MTFFDLAFEFQVLTGFAILALLAVLTLWSIWLTKLLKSKFKNDIPTYWSVGLSFLATAAILTIGKAEPFEELTLIAAAKLIAWWSTTRRTSQA